jgi:hypothetical protein
MDVFIVIKIMMVQFIIHIYTVKKYVTTDGKESRKNKDFYCAGTEYLSRLSCENCMNEYEIKHDSDGRIIRGHIL